MTHWGKAIRRSQGEEIRKEDDLNPAIKEFFENQKMVKSYKIKSKSPEWIVDVVGDVHIYNDDSSTLPGFQLGVVDGNLVVHCKKLGSAVIPADLKGSIIFDLEEVYTNQVNSSTQTIQNDLSGMECLSKTTPSKAQIQKKFESLISDCIEYDYDIDIAEIQKALEDEKLNADKFKLRIELVHKVGQKNNPNAVLEKCEIYVSDNDEDILNLTAIEKATYLAFLLYEEGLIINDIKMDFVKIMQTIYMKIPGKVLDEENGGIKDGKFTTTTLNGYRNKIRNAIKSRIKNSHLVNQFAIEGYKDEAFKIQKSTEDIRNRIREYFNVQ